MQINHLYIIKKVKHKPFQWMGTIILGLMLLAGVGCSNDDSRTSSCKGPGDCAPDEVCVEGKCQPAIEQVCINTNDCPPGYVCDPSLKLCVDPPDTGGLPDTSTPEDAGFEDVGQDVIDYEQPTVASITPADSTRGVPVDSQIVVQFSKQVQKLQAEAGIRMTDWLQRPVSVKVEYDENTFAATITPLGGPLDFYTPYFVNVSGEIKDPFNNGLAGQLKFRFSTSGNADAEAHYLEVASRYAPVVYQEVLGTSPKYDMLAPFDFDGRWVSEGKAVAARRANAQLRGTVYFSAIESETHFFLSYIYYHPFDYNDTSPNLAIYRENSMAGVMVVVDKSSEDVVAVETFTSNTNQAFTWEGSGVEARPRAEGGVGELEATLNPEALFDDSGERVQTYINRGSHDSCIWMMNVSSFTNPYCQHEAGKFRNNSGIRYVPDTQFNNGEIPSMALSGCDPSCPPGEMCVQGVCKPVKYSLRDFSQVFWPRRIPFVEESIWSKNPNYPTEIETFEYRPEGDDSRPGKAQQFMLPEAFGGEGQFRGLPPWAWDSASDSGVAKGQWFLDPIYTIGRHLRFPQQVQWSSRYCYNPYFGIDRRSEADCQ